MSPILFVKAVKIAQGDMWHSLDDDWLADWGLSFNWSRRYEFPVDVCNVDSLGLLSLFCRSGDSRNGSSTYSC